MAKNTFKQNENKTDASKKVRTSIFSKIDSLTIENKKLKTSIGFFLLISGLFFFLAYISYLFSWKTDQDKINLYWLDSSVKAENILGKFGALCAHLFVFKGFGISSILIIALFILFGIKFSFDTTFTKLKKITRPFIFFTLWVSAILGTVFSSQSILGGAFGWQLRFWGTNFVGLLGVVMILFLILVIFLTYNYKFIDFLQKLKFKVTHLVTKILKNRKLTANLYLERVKNTADETSLANNAGDSEEEKESNPIISTDDRVISSPKEDNSSVFFDKPYSSKNLEEVKEADNSDEISLKVEDKSTDVEEKVSTLENTLVDKYGEFDPTLELSKFQLPPIDLLKAFNDTSKAVDAEELEGNKEKIVKTLKDYNIEIVDLKATIGPTVTLYEIVPAPGVRISKIKNLEDDIALSLAALGIRIIAPIPGKGTIGIEVPNQHPKIVSMRAVIGSKKFQSEKMELPVVIGKTITNDTYIFDLTKMPHLLMAGATGQGKSVGLNAILTSLLYKKHPAELKFVLIDPKKVELTLYSKIERHYLAKLPDAEDAIITATDKVINTLNSLCMEMDARYDLLKKAMVRNIVQYNQKFTQRKLSPEEGHKFLPYIVLVIDEFADLIMTAGREVETPIARLAQLARAIGIHLIIATQRPSANIITGIIKANFPGRIAFRVTSGIDSRTILDTGGADQLIGKGDMLISQGNDLVRVQCAFIDTPEVEAICDFIGSQQSYPFAFSLPEYVNEVSENTTEMGDEKDALFEDAARTIVQFQQGSASLLQRKMKIGYNRAGRLIDQLEVQGIIGPFEGSKARKVLVSDLETLETMLKNN